MIAKCITASAWTRIEGGWVYVDDSCGTGVVIVQWDNGAKSWHEAASIVYASSASNVCTQGDVVREAQEDFANEKPLKRTFPDDPRRIAPVSINRFQQTKGKPRRQIPNNVFGIFPRLLHLNC